ncbi:hypothetical protein WA158_007226 [Blastocystis sp. Blastoise]
MSTPDDCDFHIVVKNEFQLLTEQYEDELDKEMPDQSIIYKYATECTKQKDHDTIENGIQLLENLADDNYETVNCLLSVVEANIKIGKLYEGRKICERILNKEPCNPKATKLYNEMEKIVKSKGVPGLLIITGVSLATLFIINRMCRRH